MFSQIICAKSQDVDKILTPGKYFLKTIQYHNIKEYLPDNQWLAIFR